jgi:putative FmdB family regulatory protein
MPIYEYKCKDCGSEFELLLFSGEEAKCPKCSSKNLEKKVSKVSFLSENYSSDTTSSSSSCSTCSSKNCSSCG